MVPFNIYEYASLGKCSAGLGCAPILRESCHALPNNSCFDGVICQLVFTTCMGYQNVNEERLQELRNKHGPTVEACTRGKNKNELSTRDVEIDPVKDLQDQVVWLKNELCKVLEEKKIRNTQSSRV
nr:hypothetical protein [Tanacetum cinerariifolium]